MSVVPLTQSAVTRIYNNGTSDKPYVQLLEIKRIGAPNVPNAQERFRLIVSDGAHYQQAMLATQLNHYVNDGKIRDACIVQLTEYICNNISNRKIIIILNLQVVSDGNGQTIGNPVNIDGGASTSSVASKPVAGAPMQQRPTPNPYQPRQTGPTTMSDTMTQHFYPISQLNPYQNKWTIKARVTNKSDMRTWQNEKSNGKLFSVDLLDQSGGQIKATMFNGAADKFYPMLQPDKVYTISKGQVKLANKKFNRVPNEYELTLNEDAEITYYGDDDSIEQQKFIFKKIHEIASCDVDTHVDVMGIVTSVQPITTIQSKTTKKDVQKRSITLVDETATQVELTLWGEQAERYNEHELGNHAVVAIKQARVGDFQGKNLSASFTSQIFINPSFPEAEALRSWWHQEGHASQITSISGIKGAGSVEGRTDQRIVFSDINAKGLGKSDKPDYFTVRGTVTFFRKEGDKPPWYNACAQCNRKTNPDGQGTFHCEKCNIHGEANPRYILSLLVCDSTGAQWLTAFNESAEKLLGKSAAELATLKEQNPPEYERVFTEMNFKPYIFKIRAKAETQNDEMRIRCHVLSAEPVDFVKESELLLKQIALYD